MLPARIETEYRSGAPHGGLAGVLSAPEANAAAFAGLECLVELRPADVSTGIQFRECLIDYTTCPNRQCIKKLL